MIEMSTAAEPAGGIAGLAADIMQSLGAPGAGLANAVDTVFPFIPVSGGYSRRVLVVLRYLGS
ncbi:hypothetical protein AB0L00_00255 [Actinoallomurus sp. NPDC052308]|uniref:hypothetical protein n=1 Tax=Actinoallomurus sp. NPDC052308 TaxID=3155530 RepID=UPI00343E7855